MMKRKQIFSAGTVAGIAGTVVMTAGAQAGTSGALNASAVHQAMGQNNVSNSGTSNVAVPTVAQSKTVVTKATTKPTPKKTTKPTPVVTTRSAIGNSVFVNFGNVQVKVTAHGKKIVDVQALQVPNQDGHSMMIARFAVPILRQQALKAQSAHISGVSGASYTSYGYQQSLQSALTRLGL
mgnify:CR=1 FL=1